MRANKTVPLAGMAILAAALWPQAAVAQPKPAASSAAKATLLGQYGDWGAYAASPGGKKICFALSKPTAQQDNPPNRRDTAQHLVYLFVSTRPDEKVRNEVSLLVTNYAFRTSADATATVGPAGFAMHTQNDGAWVKNPADEPKLVETLRKGGELVVKAVTSKGTQTTDTFSLKGAAQALDRAAQECN